jgi:hypothetical protein
MPVLLSGGRNAPTLFAHKSDSVEQYALSSVVSAEVGINLHSGRQWSRVAQINHHLYNIYVGSVA